jgi:SAM-dependent methyltransferase
MSKSHPFKTDDDWEQLAKDEPYFAVLTDDRFRSTSLNNDRKKEFFESGENYIAYILAVLERQFHCPKTVGTALDFGCGVGRLVLPLAKRAQTAIGVDISTTMLKIAADNAKSQGVNNVKWVQSDDTLSGVTETVDLLTSCIVLQHVPPERGYGILDKLLSRLATGGFGYIQIPFAARVDALKDEGATNHRTYRYYQRQGDHLHLLRKGYPDATGGMQMNHYDLSEVMCVLMDNNVHHVFTYNYEGGGHLNVELFFTKTSRS